MVHGEESPFKRELTWEMRGRQASTAGGYRATEGKATGQAHQCQETYLGEVVSSTDSHLMSSSASITHLSTSLPNPSLLRPPKALRNQIYDSRHRAFQVPVPTKEDRKSLKIVERGGYHFWGTPRARASEHIG